MRNRIPTFRGVHGTRLLLVSTLLVFLSVPAFAQEYTIKQTLFLPPQFYVGDVVELRLRIATTGDGILPSQPSELPRSEGIIVQEVRAIPIAQEYEIRIRFSSYRTGRSEIPAFTLGSLNIEPIPFETASIRKAGDIEPYGIFDPVFLPGTRLLIAISAGIALFGPLFLLLFAGSLRRMIGRLAIGVGRPYRKLSRLLDSLDTSESLLDTRQFYQQLCGAFRDYLSARSDYNYNAATTREMVLRLRRDFSGVETLDLLSSMVGNIDRAKFGHGEATAAEKHRGLSVMRSSAAEIERRHRAGGLK